MNGSRFRIFALLAVLLLARTATADDVNAAAERFKSGSELFAKGQYPAAAAAFEDAFRLAPRGAALHNAGLSWEAAGDEGRAADAFAAALDRIDFRDPQRSEATTHLQALRKRVGQVRFEGPERTEFVVAHVPHGKPGEVVHLPAGAQTIKVVNADGTSTTRTVNVQAAALVVANAAEDPAARPTPEKKPDASVTVAPSSSSVGPFFTTPRVIALGALGAAVVCGVVGGITWSQANDALDEFRASNLTSQDAHDRASTMETVTNVAFVGMGVLAVAGGALLVWTFLRPSSPRTASSGLSVRF